MIQLIAGCMTIHSAISKIKIGIQDVISPYSLDQFLISYTPRTRKRVKKLKKSKDSWIVVSRQFDFTWKSKGKFPSRRTFRFIEELGVIVGSNGSRSRVDWRIDAIKSRSFDCKRRVEMHPRRAKKRRVVSLHSLDLHQTIRIYLEVHRALQISTVITRLMDGCD